MAQRTLYKQQTITRKELDEQKALREIQTIRDQKAYEPAMSRVLNFDGQGLTKTVSYSDDKKETVWRDPDDQEHIVQEELTIDEKDDLDFMYDMAMENDERVVDDPEIGEDRDELDDFSRDDNNDIDREDMEF